MDKRDDFFVSTNWLAGQLGQSDVAIVDGSWYLPTAKRDPAAEYLAAHIPGAVGFDIDAIADKSTKLPHMLPSSEEFSRAVGALGISNDQTIVVYDGAGLASAPRVWWTFRVFGAPKVKILTGGLPQWRAEGRALASGAETPLPRIFQARLYREAVRDFEAVRKHLSAGEAQILDARPSERFAGIAAEPRPGIKSGHMPGSLNLPSGELIAEGKLKSEAELRAAFAKAGVDLAAPIVTSCGSGITAAILTLAAETLGAKKLALYDGSWTDWASRADSAIEP